MAHNMISSLSSNKVRLIARLEIKGEHVVKGYRMEGLRRVGKPDHLCRKYFHAGIDEIIFEDTVASLYGRNNLTTLVSGAAEEIFIPLCVGGGIRSIEDIRNMLRSGADKISINTQAIKTPGLITEAAKIFGSQCVVVSIQAKRKNDGTWEAFTDNGRQPTRKDAVQWAREAQDLGAGEILLTSIDNDGTSFGYDHELIRSVTGKVSIPVIASGGARDIEDISKAVLGDRANAVAVAHLLHFNKASIPDIKEGLSRSGIMVRREHSSAVTV